MLDAGLLAALAMLVAESGDDPDHAIMEQITYVRGGANLLPRVEPMWERLSAQHDVLFEAFGNQEPSFDVLEPWYLGKDMAGQLFVELATAESRDVGFCLCTCGPRDIGLIDAIWVDEAYRNQGIGSTMIRDVIGWLDKGPITCKIVQVANTNASALSFYERLGFSPRTVTLQHRPDR